MPNYIRAKSPGRTYFFTVVTYNRHPWLDSDYARNALRIAINKVRAERPFTIEAWVLLPDHMHCVWTMPERDQDYSTRWRLIKNFTSRAVGALRCANAPYDISGSRETRREANLWQRRFWEHAIRNEKDLARHFDYIHYNPVKHGFVKSPADWPYTTFHKFVSCGRYERDWGAFVEPEFSDIIMNE